MGEKKQITLTEEFQIVYVATPPQKVEQTTYPGSVGYA